MLYQADVVMAKYFMGGSSHVIVSNDADFMMHGGKNSIQTKYFFLDKSKKIATLALSFATNELAKN